MATFRYEGGLYYLTGVFLAEAATVLLKEKELVEQLCGGVLTQLVWVRDLWNGCKTPMFKSVGGCCRLWLMHADSQPGLWTERRGVLPHTFECEC
jgi:hypothetical protein